ncbi:SCO family protein [Pedobacter flavus]|uniref:SCO family protein n=1 Tax=Pedobacter flavus TaxID=3113906 RepID=A0ABU7H3G5_9SPHI|nr:SCO family protein [Pedobacter sp. VNH31]MEE1885786.1 SCO family protein [Pedobacter sp. VNH31]
MKFRSIFLFSILVLSVITGCKEEKTLPIYGERHTQETKLANGEIKVDTIYKTIPDWEFLNQDSVLINQKTFENKVYIADFFFTSCSTICPIMHRNMKTIYDEFKNNDDLMFLSHTIDFKYDKPSRLKTYAQKLGVDTKKWQFAYGSKEKVYTIAEKDYLVAANEDSTARDGYIHQGFFILIDKQRRIRGAYDGTNDEQVEKLRKDLPILLKEK